MLLRMVPNSGDLWERYMDERRSGEKHCLRISSWTGSGRDVGPGEKLCVRVLSGGVRDPVSAGCVIGSIML